MLEGGVVRGIEKLGTVRRDLIRTASKGDVRQVELIY